MIMISKIKQVMKSKQVNPHELSRKTGLTYRVVLNLHNQDEIKPATHIGTLQTIADALGVSIVDLYEVKETA